MPLNNQPPSLANNSIRSSRGMILISLISILGIITICLASLSLKTQQEIKETTTYLNRIQAKQNAFAAERYILQQITLNGKNKNMEVLKIENFPYSMSAGDVNMDVIDQNSLFNLNWLLEENSTNGVNKANMELLRSLLSVLYIDIDVAEQLSKIINQQAKINIMSNTNLKKTGREIFSISCINLLENVSFEDKKKLSAVVTVLPKESLLNINQANETMLMAIDGLLGINFKYMIENKQTESIKNWNNLEKLLADSNQIFTLERLKQLPIGFNSNFIAVYIKSNSKEYNFFLKSVIYYLKDNQPKVISRELGPNYQWLFIDKE